MDRELVSLLFLSYRVHHHVPQTPVSLSLFLFLYYLARARGTREKGTGKRIIYQPLLDLHLFSYDLSSSPTFG